MWHRENVGQMGQPSYNCAVKGFSTRLTIILENWGQFVGKKFHSFSCKLLHGAFSIWSWPIYSFYLTNYLFLLRVHYVNSDCTAWVKLSQIICLIINDLYYLSNYDKTNIIKYMKLKFILFLSDIKILLKIKNILIFFIIIFTKIYFYMMDDRMKYLWYDEIHNK